MNAVDSAEFTEWLAFWTVEAELQGTAQPEAQRAPTRDELTGKIHAWVAKHNAAVAARGG